MHEFSLAVELVDLAEAAAREAGSERVTGVTVTLGPLAGVDPRALRLAFEAASEGTALHGASLRLVETVVRARCSVCQFSFTPSEPDLVAVCPTCGQPTMDLESGDEFLLSSLELALENA